MARLGSSSILITSGSDSESWSISRHAIFSPSPFYHCSLDICPGCDAVRLPADLTRCWSSPLIEVYWQDLAGFKTYWSEFTMDFKLLQTSICCTTRNGTCKYDY